MRFILLVALLVLCGCSREPSLEAETAAVYEAFLWDQRTESSGRSVLQDSAVPVPVKAFADELGQDRGEISRGYSPEVREAIQDLVSRGRTPVRLPPLDDWYEVRISPDSVRALYEHIQSGRLRRLSDSASIVQLSAVGFNRAQTVAVLYHNVVCGWLCGGAEARVVRKHPGGWIAAEQLFSVVY